MKNVLSIAESIVKEAVDVSTLDPKIQNRIKEVKRIYQQIKQVEDTIAAQVGDLQKQIKALEKQSAVFEKELMPVLKDLQDHCVTAEGIYIELKTGRRSPKVGYDYLAEKVNSQLLAAAEEAITKAAEFAQSPSIKVTHKIAGVFSWLQTQWNNLVTWVKSLKIQEHNIEISIRDFDRLTGQSLTASRKTK